MKIKDKILSETSEETKQKIIDNANKLVMKQETLSEAALKYSSEPQYFGKESGFRAGAKWQQERMYSEEDLKSAFKVGFSIGYGSDIHAIDEKNRTCTEWFEQFKKK
jgi:hypothetical protein